MVKQNILGARHGEEKLHNSWQTGGKDSGRGGEWKQDKHFRVHPQLRPTSHRLFSILMMLPSLKSTLSTWGSGGGGRAHLTVNNCRKTTSGKEERTAQER